MHQAVHHIVCSSAGQGGHAWAEHMEPNLSLADGWLERGPAFCLPDIGRTSRPAGPPVENGVAQQDRQSRRGLPSRTAKQKRVRPAGLLASQEVGRPAGPAVNKRGLPCWTHRSGFEEASCWHSLLQIRCCRARDIPILFLGSTSFS